MNTITTDHRLDFEVAPWEPLPGFPSASEFMRFRVGTCDGLWTSTETSYDILAITNNAPGNGHFEDVIQWFAFSCLRDKKDLRFLEVWNARLKSHLMGRRGFIIEGECNVVKKWRRLKKEAQR